MFLYSRGSRGSYWPRNERVMTAVILFSSSSDLWEHKHPIFICVCCGSLTYLLLIRLTRSPSSFSLPSFLLFLLPIIRCSPPRACSLVHRAHPSRQSGQPFAPAVVCVVSVVTRLRLAWREMRPDCACGGQRGVSWVMCLVCGLES